MSEYNTYGSTNAVEAIVMEYLMESFPGTKITAQSNVQNLFEKPNSFDLLELNIKLEDRLEKYSSNDTYELPCPYGAKVFKWSLKSGFDTVGNWIKETSKRCDHWGQIEKT